MAHKRQVAPFIQTEEHCYESAEVKRAVRAKINKEMLDKRVAPKYLLPESVPPDTLVRPKDERASPPTAGFVGLWEEQHERD